MVKRLALAAIVVSLGAALLLAMPGGATAPLKSAPSRAEQTGATTGSSLEQYADYPSSGPVGCYLHDRVLGAGFGNMNCALVRGSNMMGVLEAGRTGKPFMCHRRVPKSLLVGRAFSC